MSKVWDNPYETCQCKHACGHSGASMHSYVPEFLEVVMQVQPKIAVEWGPGVNTYILLAAGARVYSVEHNPKWIPPLYSSRFTVVQTPLSDPSFTSAADFPVADLYFVDSGGRAQCILSSLECAEEHSMLMLHDAQREIYHKALAEWPYVRFLNRGLAIAGFTDRVLYFPRRGDAK